MDLYSIRSEDGAIARFDYLLGDELIASEAHCLGGGGAWTTLSDGVVHYPQSQATRDMMRIVCSYFSPAESTVAVEPGLEPVPVPVSVSEPVPVPVPPEPAVEPVVVPVESVPERGRISISMATTGAIGMTRMPVAPLG